MSIDRSIYIGHYLRVWMPKEKHREGMGTCPNCSNRDTSKFCGNCGNEMVFGTIETLPGIYDYCEEVFGDEDRFSDAYIENDLDYIIVLENNSDALGYLRLDDYELEQNLPDENERSDDWQILINALTKDGIRYERRFGIVNYYS